MRTLITAGVLAVAALATAGPAAADLGSQPGTGTSPGGQPRGIPAGSSLSAASPVRTSAPASNFISDQLNTIAGNFASFPATVAYNFSPQGFANNVASASGGTSSNSPNYYGPSSLQRSATDARALQNAANAGVSTFNGSFSP